MHRIVKGAYYTLTIILFIMTGMLRYENIPDAIPVLLIPASVSVIIVYFSETKGYRPFSVKENIKWDILLGIVFVVMLSFEEILRFLFANRHDGYICLFGVISIIMMAVSVVITIDYILFIFVCPQRDIVRNSDTTEKQPCIYRPLWLIVAAFVIFGIAYFPGIVNSDFDINWMGGGNPVWDDWHTVGFGFFVRICTLVIHSPFMVTIGQILMYLFAFNYAISVLEKYYPGHDIGIKYTICTLILGIFVFMNIGDIIKDNCSTPMLLAFSVSMLEYALNEKHGVAGYVKIAILGTGASLFRHMMIVVVLITLVCMAVAEIIKKEKTGNGLRRVKGLVIAGMAIIIVFLGITEGLAFGVLNARRNPDYVKYSIPMNLAASMVYRSKVSGLQLDDEVTEKLERIIPLDKWAEYYSPYDADPICRSWYEIGENVFKLNDPEIAGDVLSVDLYYLKTFPKECILSYFDITSPVWEISKASGLEMYSPASAGDFDDIYRIRQGKYYEFTENLKSFLASFAIGRTVFYRGGIYVFFMFVVSAVLFKKKAVEIWIAMLPALLYAATLMLSIPQPSSRYTMVFSLFAVLFGFAAWMLPGIDSNGNK